MSELVSVVIPAYSHEEHIEGAIVSALSQTYDQLEVLVQDDCSPDGTWDVIQRLAKTDSRVIATRTKTNIGGAANHLDLVSRATGTYIALLSSDDEWHPEKTALQLKLLGQSPNAVAVVGQAEFIDSAGQSTTPPEGGNPFGEPFESSDILLRHLFDHGNMLCHPASLIRRKAFMSIPRIHSAGVFASIPDFFFWVGLGGIGDIAMHSDIITKFRLHDNGANASASSLVNYIRDRNEIQYILRSFQAYSPEKLHAIFPDEVEEGLSHPSAVIRLVEYAARLRPRIYASFALGVALDVMADPENVACCMREIGFGLKELHSLTGWCDSLGTGQKYLDGVVKNQWEASTTLRVDSMQVSQSW